MKVLFKKLIKIIIKYSNKMKEKIIYSSKTQQKNK